MSNCYASISSMCTGNAYEGCDLNIFNFFFIICLYYTIYSYHSITAVFANLPTILITLPFLPVALFLYLFYLLALPIADVFNLFFPSLSSLLIPLLVFFFTGIANIRLSRLFKFR